MFYTGQLAKLSRCGWLVVNSKDIEKILNFMKVFHLFEISKIIFIS